MENNEAIEKIKKPIHTNNTTYYEVIRPCLWFAKGDRVITSKFREYYTQQSIRSLLDHEYIKIIKP